MKAIQPIYDCGKRAICWVPSVLWRSLSSTRRFLYTNGVFKQNIFNVPIISVGNLTFGGTGKTPFTIWLSEFFQDQELRPLILSRGYKGQLEHSAGILKAGEAFGVNPLEYGDEAPVLARRLKMGHVVVGKNRTANLKFYFDRVSPSVVCLEDGFQHLQIHRNLDIVLIDAMNPISVYKVAPLGFLRESMSALREAQVVILTRCDQVSSEKLQALMSFLNPYLAEGTLISQIRFLPMGLYNGFYERMGPSEQLQGERILAVAGVGSPQSFFKSLESLGGIIVERKIYPDHYHFNARDIKEILDQAQKLKARVITTEKDIVKIRRITLSDQIYFLEIGVDFLKGEKELKEKIQKALGPIICSR